MNVIGLLVVLFISFTAGGPVMCDGMNLTPYPWDNSPNIPYSAGARYTLPVTSHFCQCNATWGGHYMAPNHTLPVDQVCAQGCAMSSVSIYLRAKGVKIDTALPDPGTLNSWLRNNQGYVCDPDCDDLSLPVVHKLDPRITLVAYERMFTFSDIISWIKKGWAAIIHVENNHHFVLVTGYMVGSDGNTPNGTFIVRDSGFPRLTREFSEVTDVLLYRWDE